MKYQEIRKKIKFLSQEQRETKPMRKTVKFKGTRTMEPDQALNLLFVNRFELRHLYMAYAIIKGVKRPVWKRCGIMNQTLIDTMIKKYSEPEEVEEVA